MLVSHRYKFIYTKTRKTAGSSVESYFEPFCMPDGEWTQRAPPRGTRLGRRYHRFSRQAGAGRRRLLVEPHAGPVDPRAARPGHLEVVDFKFCVIRNPFEKAISGFYFGKRRRRKSQQGQWTDQDPQLFENWLERFRLRAPMDRNTFCIKGQFALDDVIRHEILAADMQRICERLGLPWDPERLPAFKAGLRPPEATARRLYTTPRSRQLVREAYRFELRYFGYKFPEEESIAGLALIRAR